MHKNNYSRRDFMSLTAAGVGSMLVAGCSQASQAKSYSQPNILFITTDYMRGDDLPATGAPFLKAPFLQKICDEGAVFTRHSCVSPICMPARATIATGLYPHVHNLWDNRGISFYKPQRPFLIRDLKSQGYQTVGIGKMHWHIKKEEFHYDIQWSLEGKDRKYNNDDYEKYLAERGSSRQQIKDLHVDDGFSLPRGQSCFDWPLDEELHADSFVGIKTLETINQDELATDKPWFMWMSFTGPHNPWNTPKRFTDIYRDIPSLPDGDFVEGELDNKPIEYSRHRYGYGGDLFFRYDKLNDSEKKNMRRNVRAAHYGNISFIDEWLMKVFNALEAKKQLDNTIIIFSSDHGSALFDNDMLHKGTALPTQSLVPFVVWHPKLVKPGIRSNFSTHADLYATFMELAGESNPSKTQGQSIVKMFGTQKAKIYDFVVIECAMVTWIMTDLWLVGFHHISKETDLYNLKSDPMCHYNLSMKNE